MEALMSLCEAVYIPHSLILRYGGVNEVAVQVALGNLKLCRGEAYGELAYMAKPPIVTLRGPVKANCIVSKRCGEALEFSINIPRKPLIVIDVSMWSMHTRSELNSLISQIIESIREVRRYLWDGALALTGVDEGFMGIFKRALGGMKTAVGIFKSIRDVALGNAVVLDPYGDVEADEPLIRGAGAFIIGGIVDSEVAKPRATAELASRLGLNLPRVRLTFKGSLTGVPDRINKIVSIILMVRFSGYSLEDAILANQSRADKYSALNRLANMCRACDYAKLAELAYSLGLPGDEKTMAVVRRFANRVR